MDQLFRLQPAELVVIGAVNGLEKLHSYAEERLGCCWTDYLPEDYLQARAWLDNHPQAVTGIQRGLERETLREMRRVA